MVTQRRIAPDAARFIEDAYQLNPQITAPDALRDLMAARTKGEVVVDAIPSRQTVHRILKELRDLSQGEAWTLGRSTPEEAALILPVLGEVVARTGYARTSITRREATLVAIIRNAVPELPLWDVYQAASQYVRAEAAGNEELRRGVDTFLAVFGRAERIVVSHEGESQ